MNPNKKTTSKGVILPEEVNSSKPEDDNEIEMSLRLVCSMSGNHTKAFWEDVTDSTPMTVVLKNNSNVDQDSRKMASVTRDQAAAFDLRRPQCDKVATDRSPGSVQFTSLVSASFWLVYCPNWMSSDVISLVDQIYKVNCVESLVYQLLACFGSAFKIDG